MAKLTTLLALKKLLTDEDYLFTWLKAGYTRQQRSQFKYRLDKDELSLDKIHEILTRCGFKVAVQQQWELPNL